MVVVGASVVVVASAVVVVASAVVAVVSAAASDGSSPPPPRASTPTTTATTAAAIAPMNTSRFGPPPSSSPSSSGRGTGPSDPEPAVAAAAATAAVSTVGSGVGSGSGGVGSAAGAGGAGSSAIGAGAGSGAGGVGSAGGGGVVATGAAASVSGVVSTTVSTLPAPAETPVMCWMLVSSEAAMAAPRAMECFGCASTATGRPSSPPTIWPIRGIRLEPPTSRIRSMSSIVSSALPTARRIAEMASARLGRISCSNSVRVRRMSVWTFGSITGMVTSVSLDSASFALTHSARSRATEFMVLASVASSSSKAPPSDRATKPNTASSKSIPPSRSMPSGLPRNSKPRSPLRRVAASKVPPPRSNTATVMPGSMRSRVA